MGTVKGVYKKLMARQKRMEKEIEQMKDFLQTIRLKLQTSDNYAETIMGILEAFETYKFDGIEEANYEVLTI